MENQNPCMGCGATHYKETASNKYVQCAYCGNVFYKAEITVHQSGNIVMNNISNSTINIGGNFRVGNVNQSHTGNGDNVMGDKITRHINFNRNKK